ncbi:MAG: molybdopterin-dependent oxidoreductase [Chloroflexota bacterium]|nr:MAG: oxidoreductase [Chloroflexota bacterium]
MHDPTFFPGWLRLTHLINIIFISILIRSGVQILSAFPRLYRNDNCYPGNEWLKLTGQEVPEQSSDEIYSALDPMSRSRIYTALQEEKDVSPWLAMPGHNSLGLGRHWHFFGDVFWILNGLAYVVLLFAFGQWSYLVPTSWSIVPDAWHDVLTYLHLRLPANLPGQPFDAVQRLSYFGVVFLLAPFQILAGLAMSPSIAARFPWYIKLFGGRQAARSLHFLAMIGFVLFIIVHTAMVSVHGFGKEVALIVWGHAEHLQAAVAIGVVFYIVIVVLHAGATRVSLDHPRGTQRALGHVMHAASLLFFGREGSKQDYPRSAIARYFWANGHPPRDDVYQGMARNEFSNWRLDVTGSVQQPLRLSLDDLRAMPKETQITKHDCIQGWSDVAEWGGVSVRHIMELCRPLPQARYVVFHAMDDKTTSEVHAPAGGYFFETLNLRLATHHQTILAYEMNGKPLPVPHGAPLRLRVETQLGFKMVKWLRAIEFIEDYRSVGEGMGGWREDHQYYDIEAGI